MIYKGLTRYIINAYTIYTAIKFISTIIAMQSSVPTLSYLADSNLNMCLQKWFQRKMWNYDKVNNSRSWIFCISISVTWSFKNKIKIRKTSKNDQNVLECFGFFFLNFNWLFFNKMWQSSYPYFLWTHYQIKKDNALLSER